MSNDVAEMAFEGLMERVELSRKGMGRSRNFAGGSEPASSKVLRRESKQRPSVRDMTRDADNFGDQLYLLEQLGLEVPCVSLDDPLPVFVLAGRKDVMRPGAFSPKDVDELIQKKLKNLKIKSSQAPRPMEPMAGDRANSGFKARLKRAVDSLFSVPVESGMEGKLKVRVFTQAAGLSIHYSPAYFLNPDLFLGAPSSPVGGALPPGRYIFGARSGKQPIEFSTTEFDIPPHVDVQLTEF